MSSFHSGMAVTLKAIRKVSFKLTGRQTTSHSGCPCQCLERLKSPLVIFTFQVRNCSMHPSLLKILWSDTKEPRYSKCHGSQSSSQAQAVLTICSENCEPRLGDCPVQPLWLTCSFIASRHPAFPPCCRRTEFSHLQALSAISAHFAETAGKYSHCCERSLEDPLRCGLVTDMDTPQML